MKKTKIFLLIFSLGTLLACKNTKSDDKKSIEKDTVKAISLANKAQPSKEDTMIKTPVLFNPKLITDETPLTFTFTYKNHLYKFYAYANYLLPDKKSKEQNRKQLNILASIYEGQQGDDFNDGADLKVDVPLIENTPLKISSGYFSVDNYKMLTVVDGNLTLIKSDKNIISGTFTINGTFEDKEKGIKLEKFTITDGKFEKLPVTVHYILDFSEGWVDPRI